MKILYTISALLLAASAIAGSEIDCEIIPFKGRDHTFTTIRWQTGPGPSSQDGKKWKVIQLPTGGFIGHILIKDQAAVGATARLSIREVRTDDLLEPMKHSPKIAWFGEMGQYNPVSLRRKLLHEHTWKIDKVPFKIPIIIPKSPSNLSRCVFEIKDADGQTIYACTPGEVYKGQGQYYGSGYSTAWVFTDDDAADRRLKQYAKINTVERLTELPGDWAFFAEIKAIWVDESTELDAELMRRIILSGGWIFGDKDALQPHLDKLGIPPSAILMGGIRPLVKKSEVDADVDMLAYNSLGSSYGGSRYIFSQNSYRRKGQDPLEMVNHLFDEIKTPYIIYTLVASILYAIGAAIILPVLFIRMKATRRVELWWKTPLAIAAYTIVITLIGFIAVHPKSSISDATEYRLGYSDWPSVFCSINTASLKYGGKEYGWNIPAASIVTYDNNRETYRSVHEEGDASSRVIRHKAVRGMKYSTGFAYMKETRQPFSAAMVDHKVKITTTRDVRGLCVQIANNRWIKLGVLKAGESVDVCDPFEAENIVFPDAISLNVGHGKSHRVVLSEGEKDVEPCKNCKKIHTSSGKSLELHNGCILVAAVDENDEPAVSGVQKGQRHRGRVVWISQVPVKDYITHDEKIK
jgi:hypothetical protein